MSLQAPAIIVNEAQLPENTAIWVFESVPKVVRIFTCPEAGQTNLYQTVFEVPLTQQEGIETGSPMLFEQVLSPVKLTFKPRVVALQG